MMTSQVVRLLAKEGLIERIRQVRDKRAFNLRLSEDGRALQRRAASAVRAVETQFFAALEPTFPRSPTPFASWRRTSQTTCSGCLAIDVMGLRRLVEEVANRGNGFG